jgi:arylsulfatase A-like enzyme/sugar lactone lactonase YvrE
MKIPRPAAFALLVAALPPAAAETAKPNIVLILADDLGYGDTGCYGATKLRTPNIDRLAREGVRFTQAYATGSVCSPTRYALLSGRYAWRSHHPDAGVLAPGAPLLFEPDRVTLASALQKDGYATGCVGKWHLGFGNDPGGSDGRVRYDWSHPEIKPGPLECGFDWFFGLAANVENEPRFYIENRSFAGRKPGDEVKVVRTKGKPDRILPWSDDALWEEDEVAGLLARKAVSFIERSATKPFFLYFATPIAHNPITPAKAATGTSQCGPYGDFVQELDTHVGWILAALEKAGVADNTIVIFTSDNGGVVADNPRLAAQLQAKQAGHEICGTLRGRKHRIHEGGFRVPFIVRWPGHAAATSDAIIALTDVLPTLADIRGIRLPENAAEDGVSFRHILEGGKASATARGSVILKSSDGMYAIRKGDWKFIEERGDLPAAEGKMARPNPDNSNQLYNLANDPAETTDVKDQHPEIVAELRRLLAAAREAGRSAPPVAHGSPDSFARCVDPAAVPRKLAGGMKFTEGPVWVPRDGGYLVFSDIPANELKRWTEKDGVTTYRQPSHNANGNILDAKGRLVSCEHGGRRLSILEPDGTLRTLVDRFEGKAFNAPNDAALARDGAICFTDPDYGPRDRPREIDGRWVFRFDPQTKDLRVLAKDFDKPNGIAFSPDGRRLYIADSGKPRHIRVFDVDADGGISNGRVFCAIDQGAPDGIRCDADGRLWSSAGDGVRVFDTRGGLLGTIPVPEVPANLCFGGPDGKTLFITARSSLYAIDVLVKGADTRTK